MYWVEWFSFSNLFLVCKIERVVPVLQLRFASIAWITSSLILHYTTLPGLTEGHSMKWMRSYNLSFPSSPPLPFLLSPFPLPCQTNWMQWGCSVKESVSTQRWMRRRRATVGSWAWQSTSGGSRRRVAWLLVGGKRRRGWVPLPCPLPSFNFCCLQYCKDKLGREPRIFSHVSMIYLGKSKGNTHLTYSNLTLNAYMYTFASC